MEFEKHFCKQKISGFRASFLLANFLLASFANLSHAQQNQPSSNAEKINNITPDNIGGGGGAILAKINFQITQILTTT